MKLVRIVLILVTVLLPPSLLAEENIDVAENQTTSSAGRNATHQSTSVKPCQTLDESAHLDEFLQHHTPSYNILKKSFDHLIHFDEKCGHWVAFEKWMDVQSCIERFTREGVSQDDAIQYHGFRAAYLWNVADYTSQSKMLIVVDLKDASLSGFKKAKPFLKKLYKSMKKYFRKRIFKVFLVNPPRWFFLFWKMCSGSLIPEKVDIELLGDEKTMKEELLKYIDEKNLPTEYGGTCECESECESECAHSILENSMQEYVDSFDSDLLNEDALQLVVQWEELNLSNVLKKLRRHCQKRFSTMSFEDALEDSVNRQNRHSTIVTTEDSPRESVNQSDFNDKTREYKGLQYLSMYGFSSHVVEELNNFLTDIENSERLVQSVEMTPIERIRRIRRMHAVHLRKTDSSNGELEPSCLAGSLKELDIVLTNTEKKMRLLRLARHTPIERVHCHREIFEKFFG